MRGESELEDRRRLLGDYAEDGVVAFVVVEDVAAIAAALRDEVAEIELVMLLKRLPLLFGENLFQHLFCLCRGERLGLRAQEIGGEADNRRLIDGEMKIRRALIARGDEQRVELRFALHACDRQGRLANGVKDRKSVV